MRYFILFLLLQVNLYCFSSDTLVLQAWQEQAKAYINVDIDSSRYFGQQILENSKTPELKKYQAFALNWIGIAYMQTGIPDSANYYFNRAIEFASNNDENRIVRMATFNLSVNALNQGKFELAAETGLKALEVFKKDGDSIGIGKALYHIGSCYFSLSQWGESKRYMQLALPVAQKHGTTWSQANIYGALGSIAFQEKDTLEGILNTQRSIKLKEGAGGAYYCGPQYVNISDVHMARQNWDSASWYLGKAQWASQTLGDQQLLGIIFTQKAAYFNRIDEIDSSLYYGYQAVNVYDITKDDYTRELAYYRLFEAYHSQNNLDSAIYYQTQYYDLKDSIQGVDVKERIANLDANYQLAEKDKELLQSELEIQKKNEERGVLIFVLVILVLGFLGFFFLWNVRKRKQIIESELRLANEKNRIAMDLHDHVGAELTLASSTLFSQSYEDGISSNRKKELQTIGHQLRDITELLRETVWSIQDTHISIEDLFAKLDIFQSKLFSNQAVKWSSSLCEEYNELPSEIAIEVYRIFQEGLHNAFKYAQASELKIKCSSTKKEMIIELEDNGIGFDVKNLSKFGFGLKNMKKRAQKIKAQISIDTKEDKGTKIKLTLDR